MEEKNDKVYGIHIADYGTKYVNVNTCHMIFDGICKNDYNKIVKMYMNDYLLGDHLLTDTNKVIIDKRSIKKYTNPGKRQSYFYEKMKLCTELINIFKICKKFDATLPLKKDSKYLKWEYYKFYFKLDTYFYNGIVNIGIDSYGKRHFYEINNIKKVSGISEISLNRPTDFSTNNNNII